MTDLFHIVEDAQVILRSKGVFRQCKVYTRNKRLYAAWGSGYVQLLNSGYTSVPNVGMEGGVVGIRTEQDGSYLRDATRR